MRGNDSQDLFIRLWHAPSGIQLSETSETHKNEMQKYFLISDGGLTRPTLTLAPMGMVAPWRCQEQKIFGRADSACIHWAMESIILTNRHKTFD